jgi:hypothetical protein
MTRTQIRMMALALTACACLLASCSEESRPTPTQPARVAESLTVTGARDLAEGETVALVASVRWSTGVTETVTDGVAWSSDDSRIASVDQRGVVTAVAPGDGRIRATLNAVSGTAGVTVRARRRTISGIVHESFPTEATALRGATVTATEASGKVLSVVTDAGGRFTLQEVATDARLTVDAPGYASAAFTPGPTDAPLSLALTPTQREIRESFDYVSRAAGFVTQRSYRVAVHSAGELRAAYVNSYDSASGQEFTCLEVRDAANHVLAQGHGSYDIPAGPVRLAVTPGYYDVKFYGCGSTRGSASNIAAYAGEIKHPS